MRIKFMQKLIDKLNGKKRFNILLERFDLLLKETNILKQELNKLNDIEYKLQELKDIKNKLNDLAVIKEKIEKLENTQKTSQKKVFENFLKIEIPEGHKILEYMHMFPYYDRCLPRILSFLQRKYNDFSLIDVGANIGDTAQNIRLANLTFPILAIEGDEKYYSYLERNSKIIQNIDICKTLLSDKEEESNLKLNSLNGTAGLVKSESKIFTTTLDNILAKFPLYQKSKFIKIDTDGFDTIILKGAKNYLQNTKPIIYMEYDPNMLLNNGDYGLEIFEYLKIFGYKKAIMYQNFGEYMFSFDFGNKEFISEARDFFYKNNRICYADLLIFHEEDLKIFEELRDLERNYFKVEKIAK